MWRYVFSFLLMLSLIFGLGVFCSYAFVRVDAAALAETPQPPDAGVAPEAKREAHAPPAVAEQPLTPCQTHCAAMQQKYVAESTFGCVCEDFRGTRVNYK